MATAAKSKGRDLERYRQSVAEEVSREADGFVFKQGRRGAPKKLATEKARIATFSLTEEDLRFVERATYQVIRALETGVNKSQAVRLAMRAFAGMSVEELRKLLSRTPAKELTDQITHGARG